MRHTLSNVDEKTRTATCSNCGFVKIKVWNKRLYADGTKKNMCYYAFKYGNDTANYLATAKPEVASQCQICGSKKKLVFDHDHATGKHRGWLCISCNSLLGNAKDDPNILRSAIAYLSTQADIDI